jgi:hypothetical protein
VVALHRMPAPCTDPPAIAVLLDPDGKYWLVAVGALLEAEDDNVYHLENQVITLRLPRTVRGMRRARRTLRVTM